MAKKPIAQAVEDAVNDMQPETPPTEEAVGSQNNDRLAMLDRISAQNDKDRVEEMVEIDDDGQVTKFVPSNVEQELTTGDDEVAARELKRMEDEVAEPEEPSIAAMPVKHTIKVNGKEVELTLEEIIARAQKVEAADSYLAEASRLRKEALQQAQPQVPSQEDRETAELDRRRALVRAIQMGSEEEAMAAIAELQPKPSVMTADLAKTIDERLTFKEAVGKFQTEYKDILADPYMHKMALQRDQELMQQGDKRDYWTRYDEIGKELRAWRDGLVKTVAPVESPPVENVKQTRKSAAPAAPKLASVKAPPPTEEDDSEDNPSAVIAEIAKRRGGPQWMRG